MKLERAERTILRSFGILVLLPLIDRRKPHGLRPVTQQDEYTDCGDDTDDSRTPISPLPAEKRNQAADHQEGQPFTDRMGGAPDAIGPAALPVGKPGRHRDDSARCPETLEPAVQAPQKRREPDGRRKAHQDVAQGSEQEGGGKEAANIGVVGQKAVRQLADGISVEQRRTDRPELGGGEYAFVDQRLFHHPDCQPAHVDQAIADRDGQHHPDAIAPVQPVDLGRAVEPGSIRPGRE